MSTYRGYPYYTLGMATIRTLYDHIITLYRALPMTMYIPIPSTMPL